jgi:hypothetical protein
LFASVCVFTHCAGEPLPQTVVPEGHVEPQKPAEHTAHVPPLVPASVDVTIPESPPPLLLASCPEAVAASDPPPVPASAAGEASSMLTDASCTATEESSAELEASSPVDTSGDATPASTTTLASSEAPASSPVVGRLATVESSATKPSLKCVTWPVATFPAVVVVTVSKPPPPSVDQTMIGWPTPPGSNVRCTVTGILKTSPSGPNL